jgi:hypothetical protein
MSFGYHAGRGSVHAQHLVAKARLPVAQQLPFLSGSDKKWVT